MLALIGKKIGMTQLFNEEGVRVPLTVVQVMPTVLVRQRTVEKNGYDAFVLGADPLRKKSVRKPYGGQFPQGIAPTRNLIEVKDFEKEFKTGEALGAEIFEGVKFVDVRGITKGRGFQGVVKRHGFKGGPAQHGSKFHREMGSVGTGAFRKIAPGTHMPGRMGAERFTVQNLRLFQVDKEKGLLLIRGAVPGRRGGTVIVMKAKKK
jgi:large subunit ribosomal protein L3